MKRRQRTRECAAVASWSPRESPNPRQIETTQSTTPFTTSALAQNSQVTNRQILQNRRVNLSLRESVCHHRSRLTRKKLGDGKCRVPSFVICSKHPGFLDFYMLQICIKIKYIFVQKYSLLENFTREDFHHLLESPLCFLVIFSINFHRMMVQSGLCRFRMDFRS